MCQNKIGYKITTNIWNIQGFCIKKSNLFEVFKEKPCYSHNCATVTSGGPCFLVGRTDVTTNI